MNTRYFGFESITGIDENGLTKVELATDSRSSMKIETTLHDFDYLTSMFLFMDQLIRLKPAPYDLHRIDYKDWYANELIRRIREDESYYENQADAKKEVLRELLIRRNKLTKQLDKALSYYHENKDRIDDIERIRANYQKSYPGPFLTSSGNNLIFEGISEYGDLFFQISLRVNFDKDRENIPGSGWVEYSKYFSDNIKSLTYSAGGINFSNTKPRSDIRVLRRGDNQPFRLFDDDQPFFTMIQELAVLSYFDEKGFTTPLELSKGDLLVILQQCKNSFPQNHQIQLKVSGGHSSFQVMISGNELHLFVMSDLEIEGFPVNSTIFLCLEPILHRIQSAQLTFYPHLFGVSLEFTLGENEGRVYSNPRQSLDENYLKSLLTLYLSNSDDDLALGKKGQLGSIKFDREIDPSKPVNSHRIQRAFLLLELERNQFRVEDGQVIYTNQNTMTVIKKEKALQLECDCGSFNSRFLCPHTIASLLLGYQEGIFNA